MAAVERKPLPAHVVQQFTRMQQLADQLVDLEANPRAPEAVRRWAAAMRRDIEGNAIVVAQVLAAGPLDQAQQALAVTSLRYMAQALQSYNYHVGGKAQEILASLKAPAGTGVWSWNPNLWGMSQEEANAYKISAANAAAEVQKIDYAADEQAPDIMATLSATVKGATQSTGMLYNVILWGGAAALGVWAYGEYKAAQLQGGLVKYAKKQLQEYKS